MLDQPVDWAVAVVSGLVILLILWMAGSAWMFMPLVIAAIIYDNEANQWAATSPSSPPLRS